VVVAVVVGAVIVLAVVIGAIVVGAIVYDSFIVVISCSCDNVGTACVFIGSVVVGSDVIGSAVIGAVVVGSAVIGAVVVWSAVIGAVVVGLLVKRTDTCRGQGAEASAIPPTREIPRTVTRSATTGWSSRQDLTLYFVSYSFEEGNRRRGGA
jgi:hypothetical protein